jgi:hypothetical protein
MHCCPISALIVQINRDPPQGHSQMARTDIHLSARFLHSPFPRPREDPVIPRNVLLARARPSWTAASKLMGEAAVIFDTLATAISGSLVYRPPIGRQ